MTERRIRLPGQKVPKSKKRQGYVIIRTRSAGVFAGTIQSQKDQTIVLINARRIWYWKGAASLSQLAMHGVKYPQDCKFPEEVEKIKLFEVIEIIETTIKAEESIKGVPIWSA